MSPSKFLCLASVVFTLAGCAMGNQYSYQLDSLPLPITGSGPVGLAVADNRPYVLNGDKAADFVGLQRGGFGNPFDVTTQSGRPLADDMEQSLAMGLAERGYDVRRLDQAATDGHAAALAADRDGLLRVITLDVQEWKSDAMLQLTLHHDLTLRVFDRQGALLAESNAAEISSVGGARMETDNAESVRASFERIIAGLFSNKAIRAALDNPQ